MRRMFIDACTEDVAEDLMKLGWSKAPPPPPILSLSSLYSIRNIKKVREQYKTNVNTSRIQRMGSI